MSYRVLKTIRIWMSLNRDKVRIEIEAGTRGYCRMLPRLLPVQAAQQGAFFSLVSFHALQNIIQHLNRLNNVGPLVKHDALGSLAHGGIGDFGPAWLPRLGQSLQYLSGPDHRKVRRFGQP